MSSHGNRENTEESSLAAFVAKLRERCKAAARFQGGSTYYHEEVGIFRDFANENGLFLAPPPKELDSPPDDEGNEHQVWFRPQSATFLKATWPGHFGMLVVHRPDEEPAASPIDYLERWQLHNEVFGDSVEFLGVLDTPDGMRLIISQPAIEGSPATLEQIGHFFTESGWRPFHIGGNLAYFDPERRLVVSDTHRANLILMEGGMLAPIDLRVQPLTGSLLEVVRSLT